MATPEDKAKKKGGIKEGMRVWVKDPTMAGTDLFTKGYILSLNGNKATVETTDGIKTQELVIHASECHQLHPGDDVPDHCQLMYLSQPTLLENTKRRYMQDKIYTYVGDILVAVNPFNWVEGMYGEHVMKQCRGKRLGLAECGPHAYAISEKVRGEGEAAAASSPPAPSRPRATTPAHAAAATTTPPVSRPHPGNRPRSAAAARPAPAHPPPASPVRTPSQAYAAMKKRKANQCIVVSGESGAGKTETNRQLMNYLVWRGSDAQSSRELTQKIVDTNPILEAFGNAKTTRNKNSSRFGRYVLIEFDGAAEVMGAEVRTFLLERSRVTGTSKAKERSYHVLYQLVSAKTAHANEPITAYRYLSMSGCTSIEGIDDAADHADVSKAMLSVGIRPDEADMTWSYVASMLYLGNIDFGKGEKAAVADGKPLAKAEGQLGVASLEQLLVKRSITVNGETTWIDHTPQEAAMARDSLVKIMYARLFTYLVKRINATVHAPGKTAHHIGLLDVYGFEFFEVNSFEQLCINFANEKLQQFFLSTVFQGEEIQYKEEGVPWTPIAYHDNKDVIELCENPTCGVYPTLDSQCRAPNTSGKTFCGQLHDLQSKSKVFGAPKMGKGETRRKDIHFVVKHFAGDVVYEATEFLEKNNDSLNPDVEAALIGSSIGLVVDICTPEAAAAPTGKGGANRGKSSFSSVGAKFVKSLRSLMEELGSSEAHFIRCIKSNPELLPRKLHGVSVIDQLRMSGTLDAVKLIQGGYPTRIPYDSIHGRYKDILKGVDGIDVDALSPPEFCEAIAEACGVGKFEYYLGVTKMFFKMGAAHFLEDMRDADPEEMRDKLVEMFALFQRKRGARPIIEKNLHMLYHRRQYAVLLEEKRRREEEERRKEEERKRKEEEERKRKEAEHKRREEAEARRREAEEKQRVVDEERRKKAEKSEAWAASMRDEDSRRVSEADEAAKKLSDVEAMINALEDDDDLEAAVEEAGGVKALIEMAGKHEDSPVVQAQFAGVLRDLCISDEIAIDINEAGGTEALIECARIHYDSVEVQSAVAGALRNLSELDQIAVEIATAGGIEVLIDACARHPDNGTVAARVAGALWGLSVHDDIAELIGDMGGTDSLIVAAKNHPDNEEVQASTAGAMRNLSVSDDNKHSIADMEGLEVLIQASEAHIGSSLVQAQVAGALRNLSLNDEVAEQIAVSGGIEALVAASGAHSDNSKVQAGVAGALRNLSVNDEIAEEIATAGGIDALIQASEKHPNNSDVQAEVAGALWGLSVNDEIEEAIAAADGISVLVLAAKNHFQNAKVQARVAGALRKLSANDDNKHEIARAEVGGIEMLIRSSQIHRENAVVQAGVAGALSNLSVDDEIERKIAAEGGIEVLVAAAKSHIDNVKVQARVVRALTNLSVHEENKARIASKDSIATLIQSSYEHADSAEVQAGVAGALRNLSVSPQIADLIVKNDAIRSLIQAAQVHTTNAIVQAGVAGALRNLSVTDSTRKAILAAGGMKILDLAETLHADNEKLQLEVAGARRNLMGEPADKSPKPKPKPAPAPAARPSTAPAESTPTEEPASTKGRSGSPRGRSPLRRPSFGRKKSGSNPPAGDDAKADEGSSGGGKKMSFFGGFSRRSKSPRRDANK